MTLVTRGDSDPYFDGAMDKDFFLHAIVFASSGGGDFKIFQVHMYPYVLNRGRKLYICIFSQVLNTPRFSLPVVNRVRLRNSPSSSSSSLALLEEYDLQGRNLEGVTLPFPPYVYLSGCGEGVGGTCRGEEGYLVDLVRVLGNRVRFDSRAIVKTN